MAADGNFDELDERQLEYGQKKRYQRNDALEAIEIGRAHV